MVPEYSQPTVSEKSRPKELLTSHPQSESPLSSLWSSKESNNKADLGVPERPPPDSSDKAWLPDDAPKALSFFNEKTRFCSCSYTRTFNCMVLASWGLCFILFDE